MDIKLKDAFIISSFIHASFLAPFCTHDLVKQNLALKNPVVVDYVILKEMTNVIAANKNVAATPEAQRIDVKKEAKAPVRDTSGQKEKDVILRKEAKAEKKVQETAGKEARIRSSKDYINYYEGIKDRIKARLKENYKFYSNEGDVYLSFALSAKGALLTYAIDRARSTKDEFLIHITAASLKAVSPLPPIPKAISAPKTSFNIIISFKK